MRACDKGWLAGWLAVSLIVIIIIIIPGQFPPRCPFWLGFHKCVLCKAVGDQRRKAGTDNIYTYNTALSWFALASLCLLGELRKVNNADRRGDFAIHARSEPAFG